jgi:hypothetical protein
MAALRNLLDKKYDENVFERIFKDYMKSIFEKEISEPRYHTGNYERRQRKLTLFVIQAMMGVNDINYLPKYHKCFAMKILVSTFIENITKTFQSPSKPGAIFCTAIPNKSIGIDGLLYPISFLTMYDYAGALDIVLTNIGENSKTKEQMHKMIEDKDSMNAKEYELCKEHILDVVKECPYKLINKKILGNNSLFELSVRYASYSTMILLLNKYRPVVQRDDKYIIYTDKNNHFIRFHPNRKEIADEVYNILWHYRKAYTLMAFKEGNEVKYYSIKCENEECRHKECNKQLLRTGEKKKIVFDEEEYLELHMHNYRRGIKRLYKLMRIPKQMPNKKRTRR